VPQALEEVNFWQALKGMVKSTTVGTTLRTNFEAKGKVPVLPPAWQENLLRIGQEALSNTLKYARAKQFRTRLTANAKEIRLELCDDGDGFPLIGPELVYLLLELIGLRCLSNAVG
jgi:signal transduction histidine kinase